MNNVLSMVYEKYSKFNSLMYIVDANHSPFSNDSTTIKYHGNAYVYVNNIDPNDSIKEFIIENHDGSYSNAYLDDHLFTLEDGYVNSKDKKVIEKKQVTSPYTLLRRGYIKQGFSNCFFNKNAIKTETWNEDSTIWSVTELGDTLYVNAKIIFSTPNIFNDEETIEGYRSLVLKINKKDSLIYYYEEAGKFSVYPYVERMNISNYQNLDTALWQIKKKSAFEHFKSYPQRLIPNSSKVKSLRSDLAMTFIDNFKIYNSHDDSFHLAELGKRYLVIDFWFKGCPPCIHLSKELNKLANQYSWKNTEIIGVNYVNTSKEVLLDYEKIMPNIRQFYIKDRSEIPFMDDQGAPTMIIYDTKEKKVLYKSEGYKKEYVVELLKIIRNLDE